MATGKDRTEDRSSSMVLAELRARKRQMLNKILRLMTAPAALTQTVAISVVFCLITYLHEESVSTAIQYAITCFVLLQVGYFVGIVFLVLRESKDSSK